MEGGADGELLESQDLGLWHWVSWVGPTAVHITNLMPPLLASACRDPHAAGGAVQMPGAAIRVSTAAATGPPGVFPQES